ncbi:MAG: ATP-dependent DNA ligase [Nanobdellota archaeon]
MRYESLAKVFDDLSNTSSRLEKTTILADFLKTVPEETVEKAILLLQGRVFPEWDPRTVGLAGKLVIKAVAEATGMDTKEVESSFRKEGDLGIVIQRALGSRRQKTLFSTSLSVDHVYKTLQKLATLEGMKSQSHKLATLNNLLTNATPLEAKFIVRTVLEDLRIGTAEGTLKDATAFAFFTTSFSYDKEKNAITWTMKNSYKLEEVKEDVKRALDLTADVAKVITHIKKGHPLSDIRLQVGTPCKVMLARKEQTFDDAFERTGFPVRIEYKYDGFRLQIHKKNDKVWLFTRRLEDVTTQFPDVVKGIQKHVSAQEAILDAEIVGYDPVKGVYKPFQYISQRIRRKYDIDRLVKELPVEVNVFDILLLQGKSLIDNSLEDRLEQLKNVIRPKKRVLVLAKGKIVSDLETAQGMYAESLNAGNEGVMIKDLSETYKPGGRVSAWIKMKPVMEELDLVIVKAHWGEGKRSSWMTSFTLACRRGDSFLTIGKVGTGMKEEPAGDGLSFPELTEKLKPLITKTSGKEVIVKPEVVVTVAYEEIQRSSTYSAGYALRFPRTVRFRPDRNASDIATREDIIELFEQQ